MAGKRRAAVESDSTVVSKGPCECGSSDGKHLYDDGHSWCYVCEKYFAAEGDAPAPARKAKAPSGLIPDHAIEVRGIRARKLTDETCQHFGYGVADWKGKKVQVAPYYDADGNLVAQHLRTADKTFPWLGDSKAALPFGSSCFPKSGKMLTITEGEIDAMSLSQVQGNAWPVWSIGCGASKEEDGTKVRRYIGQHLDLFAGFERVNIMFDMDEAGRNSARAAAEVLGPKAHICELPSGFKDANDMLVAGKTKELIDAMWKAKPHRPDGIVSMADLLPRISLDVEFGKTFTLPTFTALTYGRRYGQVIVVAAGVGTGKTDFLLQEVCHTVAAQREPVGLFFLETPPEEVGVRLAGKLAGKTFHIPDGSWTPEEKAEHLKALADLNLVHCYDSTGLSDWDVIAKGIRFLAHAHGVRYFVVDNLTQFAVGADDERRELERVMGEIAGLAQELDAFIWVVSHLATPEGKPHENGGQIMLRHIKGSRGIAAFAHYCIGLERDQQAEDEEERMTTTIRFIKDRFTGRANGKTVRAIYDPATGMLSETRNPFTSGEDDEGEDNDKEGEF